MALICQCDHYYSVHDSSKCFGTTNLGLNQECACQKFVYKTEDTSFVWMCRFGKTTLDKIDDFIDDWHNGAGINSELSQFLGMTEKEYALWVQNPAALGSIVYGSKRCKKCQSLDIVDGCHDYRLTECSCHGRDFCNQCGSEDVERLEIKWW